MCALRLYKMYMFCPPMIFYGLWKMVSPFIDPVTREKVVFVLEKDAAGAFTKDIDAQVRQGPGTGVLA